MPRSCRDHVAITVKASNLSVPLDCQIADNVSHIVLLVFSLSKCNRVRRFHCCSVYTGSGCATQLTHLIHSWFDSLRSFEILCDNPPWGSFDLSASCSISWASFSVIQFVDIFDGEEIKRNASASSPVTEWLVNVEPETGPKSLKSFFVNYQSQTIRTVPQFHSTRPGNAVRLSSRSIFEWVRLFKFVWQLIGRLESRVTSLDSKKSNPFNRRQKVLMMINFSQLNYRRVDPLTQIHLTVS